MSKNAKKQLKAIQAEQIKANSIIEKLQQAINIQDFELGNGINVPKFIPLGNQKFEFKIGEETWIFSLERK